MGVWPYVTGEVTGRSEGVTADGIGAIMPVWEGRKP